MSDLIKWASSNELAVCFVILKQESVHKQISCFAQNDN